MAQAGVIVSGTRIIYPATSRDISVQLSNVETTPSLIQTWVDRGDAQLDPSRSDAPFLVTPPMARIDGKKKQIIRLTALPMASVPTDRESVFWFNLLDVPAQNKSKVDKNSLQVALRTRIKIFYRPDNMPGTPEKAAEDVQWQTVKTATGYSLHATNNSAYNVSLSLIEVNAGGNNLENTQGGMIPAKGTADFSVKGSNGASNPEITYSWINDYGHSTPVKYSSGRKP